MHKEFNGPFLGPKPSEEQKRMFDSDLMGSSFINKRAQTQLNYGAGAAAQQ
jgi:hypothetical protein